MNRTAPSPPLLDANHAAFIQSGVSIMAASSGPANIPSLERAIGCKVASHRQKVTIFVASASAQNLMADVRRSGRIAVVFTEPPTHRTIQLKGDNAAVVPTVAADWKIVQAYAEAMIGVLGAVGREEPMVRAMLSCPREDLVAIAFAPAAAFTQTPGPRAGMPLKG